MSTATDVAGDLIFACVNQKSLGVCVELGLVRTREFEIGIEATLDQPHPERKMSGHP